MTAIKGSKSPAEFQHVSLRKLLPLCHRFTLCAPRAASRYHRATRSVPPLRRRSCCNR